MSVKKPVVLGDNGLFEVIQPGDTLPPENFPGGPGASNPALTWFAKNLDTVDAKKGFACAVHSSGLGVVLAKAADINKPAVGLMQKDVPPSFSDSVQISGIFEMSDWTQVTGAGLLIPGRLYFLDPVNGGKLTLTPPTTAGQVVQLLGKALTQTKLNLDVHQPILL